MPVGIKNMNDPYGSYYYIDIQFQLKTSGGSLLFAPDLGLNAYGIQNGNDIGCEYILGLTPYTGISLQCTLIQGPAVPTSTDFAIVRITNYASVFAGISGNEIIINIPIVNPQCKSYILISFIFIRKNNKYKMCFILVSGASAGINIALYRVDNKIVNLIKTRSSLYSLPPTSSLNAAGSFSFKTFQAI